jgi:hypothetical protein
MLARKALLTLSAFLFVSSGLFAQNHDPEGYYINKKGDTVKGRFPNYAEYGNSPAEVPFQPSGAGNQVLLVPDNCVKFSVGHADAYIAFKGKRLTNPTNFHNTNGQSGDAYEDVSIFLRELYNDGQYQLFEFKGADRSNFYTRNSSGEMNELYYKEYLAYDNGTGADNVVQSPLFRQQLGAYFGQILQTDPGLWSRIEHANYTGESLRQLFYAMTKRSVPKVKEEYPAQVFIGFGASFNTLTVSAESMLVDPEIDQKVTSGKYSSQTSALIEAGVKLFSQRNGGRLFFTMRVNYYKFQNKSSDFADTYNYNTYNTIFKSSVLSFPAGIGYKLVNTPDFSLELAAGAVPVILFQNTQTQNATNGTASASSTQDDGKSVTLSFFAETAIVVLKRVSVFGAWYSPCQIADFQEYNPAHSSIKFGLRYFVF